MSIGLEIYNSSGALRLNLASSCAHYLGSVTKTLAKPAYRSTYQTTFECPVAYSGRIVCVINWQQPGVYFSDIIYYSQTRVIDSGTTLYIEVGGVSGIRRGGLTTVTFIGV